jgi:rSAM/selenodomain-associated transferase 2
MNISIIIPTYNEENNIGEVISYLKKYGDENVADIIVSDGSSTDNTVEIAKRAGAKAVISPGKGRAAQMNYGASIANSDILYFIHADCIPPATFVADLQNAVIEGYDLGRYRTKFASNKTILKLNAWFTRFDLFVCMGGDQTLFITKTLFETCNGFKEEMKIMEEYEFCERARQKGRYRILNGSALVSARKYATNSWLRVQIANSKVVQMYKKGASQQEMLDNYRELLSYRKNSF